MTEQYTPSVAEMREYVETGGEPRPWVELDEAEEAREQFRAEAFDRMIEAVRAEERRDFDEVMKVALDFARHEEREKAAQIAETSYEDQPTWLRNGIAARIRNQEAGE